MQKKMVEMKFPHEELAEAEQELAKGNWLFAYGWAMRVVGICGGDTIYMEYQNFHKRAVEIAKQAEEEITKLIGEK
jgi:hypothetical protein